MGGQGGTPRKSQPNKFLLIIVAMSFVVGEPPLPKNITEKITEYIAVV